MAVPAVNMFLVVVNTIVHFFYENSTYSTFFKKMWYILEDFEIIRKTILLYFLSLNQCLCLSNINIMYVYSVENEN